MQSTSSLNVPTSQIVAPNNPSNEKPGDSLNDCVDSFSHVYCEYICQNEVPNLMCTGNPNSVSIFHANVDGLNSKLDDINEVFSGCKSYPDVITISETGLRENIDSEHVAINGYNVIERNDSPTNKGRVSVYVTDQLDYDVKDYLS